MDALESPSPKLRQTGPNASVSLEVMCPFETKKHEFKEKKENIRQRTRSCNWLLVSEPDKIKQNKIKNPTKQQQVQQNPHGYHEWYHGCLLPAVLFVSCSKCRDACYSPLSQVPRESIQVLGFTGCPPLPSNTANKKHSKIPKCM